MYSAKRLIFWNHAQLFIFQSLVWGLEILFFISVTPLKMLKGRGKSKGRGSSANSSHSVSSSASNSPSSMSLENQLINAKQCYALWGYKAMINTVLLNWTSWFKASCCINFNNWVVKRFLVVIIRNNYY